MDRVISELTVFFDDNKTKIKKYVDRFNELVEKYKNE